MSIFGAAFDASTGRWIAFNEEILASLLEHDTAVETLEAFRRYREMQRTKRSLNGSSNLGQLAVVPTGSRAICFHHAKSFCKRGE